MLIAEGWGVSLSGGGEDRPKLVAPAPIRRLGSFAMGMNDSSARVGRVFTAKVSWLLGRCATLKDLNYLCNPLP